MPEQERRVCLDTKGRFALPLAPILPDDKNIFSDQNTKTGDKIKSFNLPAVAACPGRSELCEKVCYAIKKNSRYFRSQFGIFTGYWRNFYISLLPDFIKIMTTKINKKFEKGQIQAFRWHVSGDIYDAEYAKKIATIIKNTYPVVHFAYTRSWQVREIVPELGEIAKLENAILWLSADKTMPVPPIIRNTRIAYLQSADDDIPKYAVDLIFRKENLRKTVLKKLNGVLVCPTENGVTKTTCEKCAICFSKAHHKRSVR